MESRQKHLLGWIGVAFTAISLFGTAVWEFSSLKTIVLDNRSSVKNIENILLNSTRIIIKGDDVSPLSAKKDSGHTTVR